MRTRDLIISVVLLLTFESGASILTIRTKIL